MAYCDFDLKLVLFPVLSTMTFLLSVGTMNGEQPIGAQGICRVQRHRNKNEEYEQEPTCRRVSVQRTWLVLPRGQASQCTFRSLAGGPGFDFLYNTSSVT